MSALAILDGRVITPEGVKPGGVLVRDGRVVAVGTFAVPEGAQRIEAKGKLIAPGIIDVGVFAIDPAAFKAGGITRALLMPDQSQPIDSVALVERMVSAGKPHVWIHPLAAATQGLNGTELAEIGLMGRAGAAAVATGRGWIADSGVMARLLAYAGALGLVVVAHAEDGGLADGAVATATETATRMGLPSAPVEAEALAVARDLMLVEVTGAPLHFRQITTARALDLIRAAKAKGLPVTCGITPAHLLLSDVAMSDFRTFARLSPPLREERDRQACLAALADGTIDILCSGHDPRGPDAKRLPFADAEPGMAGAETLLALGLGLVRDGTITIERLFDLVAGTPAARFGLPGGRIEEGAEADLMLIDEGAPWRIASDRMVALAGNTPFDGLPVQGRIGQVVKGGVVL